MPRTCRLCLWATSWYNDHEHCFKNNQTNCLLRNKTFHLSCLNVTPSRLLVQRTVTLCVSTSTGNEHTPPVHFLHRVTGSLEAIPGANPLQGTISHTHSGPFGNASQPTMHVFGLGKEKPLKRTCKLCAHGVEAGFKPPTPKMRGNCANY